MQTTLSSLLQEVNKKKFKTPSLLFIYIGDFSCFYNHRTTVDGTRVWKKCKNELTSQNFLMLLWHEWRKGDKNASIITNEKGFFRACFKFFNNHFFFIFHWMANDGLEWVKQCERVLLSMDGFVYCLCVRLMWLIDLIFINSKYPKNAIRSEYEMNHWWSKNCIVI